MTLSCPPKLTVAMRYIPLIPRTYGAIWQRFSFIEFAGEGLVELSGIEPLTSCMPCKRSPS